VTIRKLKLQTTRDHAGKRLNETLAQWLSNTLERPVSKAKARKLILAGAVYVNGRRVGLDAKTLVSGLRIEAHVDIEKLFGDSTSHDREFELTAGRVLFEDEDLIFIDKPPGLPAQPTLDHSRDNLFAAVSRFLAGRDRRDEAYVGVHHRLDRDTSGVVLFTKSKRVNAKVAESFSSRRVTKIYQAITISGPNPDAEWTIKNYVGKIASKSKRSRYGAVESGGDLAETFFRVISRHEDRLRIEAVPKTGRTHQIRVHLSEYGLPILGDDLYGAPHCGAVPRLMLHAVQLVLPHPITGRDLSVKSSLPDDFLMALERHTSSQSTC
jgi:RluA family pseudouridine synthase